MINIFLSYAHEDIKQARKIFHILDGQPAVDVWFDKESLQPGQKWEIELRKAIRNSRYFVLLISSNSTGKKGFYQHEIREALKILDEYPDDEIYLVPVRLDECTPHFEQIRTLQYLDLFPDFGVGISKLKKLLQVHRREETSEQYNNTNILRLTAHQASFKACEGVSCYFLNVTNLSDNPIEITHVWYEDSDHYVQVSPKSRPLPKRLEANEVWSTWIPLANLPEIDRKNAYSLFRARTSSGEILASVKENTIPIHGSVPGGKILTHDIETLVNKNQ